MERATSSGVPQAMTRPPSLPPSGPEVDDAVRGRDDVQVVLDDDDRVASVDRAAAAPRRAWPRPPCGGPSSAHPGHRMFFRSLQSWPSRPPVWSAALHPRIGSGLAGRAGCSRGRSPTGTSADAPPGEWLRKDSSASSTVIARTSAIDFPLKVTARVSGL